MNTNQLINNNLGPFEETIYTWAFKRKYIVYERQTKQEQQIIEQAKKLMLQEEIREETDIVLKKLKKIELTVPMESPKVSQRIQMPFGIIDYKYFSSGKNNGNNGVYEVWLQAHLTEKQRYWKDMYPHHFFELPRMIVDLRVTNDKTLEFSLDYDWLELKGRKNFLEKTLTALSHTTDGFPVYIVDIPTSKKPTESVKHALELFDYFA
jgi:hypothetical protein